MTINLSALQKQRRDSAANWTAENPTLLAGEIGIESDTGKIKIGNGSSTWTSLAYQGIIPSSGVYPLSQLLMPSGTVSAPSISFDGDTNLGIYRSGTDQLSFTTAGTERLRIDATGQIEAVSLGTAAAPTYSWVGDPNTGIYSPGADQVALATNGTGRLFVGHDGFIGFGDNTGNHNYSFYSNANTTIRLANSTTTTGVNRGGLIYQGGADLTVSNQETGFLRLMANLNEGLRIASSGQIQAGGLGTASAPAWSYVGDPNTGIYSPGADQVAISSNGVGRLFVDASGNVGVKGSTIITTSAASAPTLQIGDGAGSPALVMYSSSTGTSQISFADATTGTSSYDGYLLYSQSSQYFAIGTASTERMRLDSSGRLGLGTSSFPGSGRLQVVGSNASTTIGSPECVTLIDGDSNNDFNILNFATSAGGTIARIGAKATTTGAYPNSVGELHFAVQNGASTSTAMVIDASSRVGIGSTSPPLKLSVDGDTWFGNGAGVEIGRLFNDSGVLHLRASSNVTGLALGTNGTERARIDSSGRLLVGTSSSAPFSTLPQLVLQGTSVSDPAIFLARNVDASSVSSGNMLGNIAMGSRDGGIGAQISAEGDGTWSSTSDCPSRLVFSTTADGASSPTERMRLASDGTILSYGNGDGHIAASNQAAGTTFALFAGRHSAASTTTGTNSFIVYTNGNAVNTNNSYGAISDIKLKENIVDANSQWDDLKALQVRNYNFIENETHTQIGLIAQEVELVSPGLVSESPDRDAEGNDLGTVTKSVNYSVLYMKAVKALQEAIERIETLEAKVAALEGV